MVRPMLRMVGVAGVLVVGATCSFSSEGLDGDGDPGAARGPRTSTAGGAMPPPAAGAPPSAQPAAQTVMRVRDVKAKRISVGVLFAHAVKADDGTIVTSGPPLSGADLKAQIGREDVEVPELVVDVLYAHDVKADFLTVRELHASDVKIDGDEGDDDSD